MSEARTVDVAGLPEDGFGTCSEPWWGTLGFMFAEATTLALCAATYLYLARRYEAWPPAGLAAPDLLLPTLSALLLTATLVPARMLARAAKRHDRRAVVRLLVIGLILEAVALTLRALEFQALNVRWDTNSYGSIVWWTLGIHTTLLAGDLAETAVFAAIFLTGREESKHYSDTDDVVLYWYFVVLGWLPLYALIFLSPRLL